MDAARIGHTSAVRELRLASIADEHETRRAMNQPLASQGEREVRIPTGDEAVVGDLVVPAGAKALAVFAHGSGSSRHSPRNVWVAEQLHRHAIATLLFDLLTPTEDRRDAVTAEHRFDIALLGRRLVQAIDWCATHPDLAAMPLGSSAAVPAAPPRSSQPRNAPTVCAPWCRAAGAPTSPAPTYCRACAPRRC